MALFLGVAACVVVCVFLVVLAMVSDRSTLQKMRVVQTVALEPLPTREGCLHFMHIPKTGGTALRNALPGTPLGGANRSNWRNITPPAKFMHTGIDRCFWGHIPPAVFGQMSELYAGCDTFCVVRNPVTRMVSEYLFRHGKCKVASFEKWVRKQMKETNPHRSSCHWIPQSVYVVGPNSPPGFGCRHVLRYENLEGDLARLMSSYQVKVTLPKKNVNKRCSHRPRFEELVVPLVEQLFADDLHMFGYNASEPKEVPRTSEALAAAFGTDLHR